MFECSITCCLLLYRKLSQSLGDIIPMKTSIKPVLRSQGAAVVTDGDLRPFTQIHTQTSSWCFSQPLHQLSFSTVHCYSSLSCFLSQVYWQTNNTYLTLMWNAIHEGLQLLPILCSFLSLKKNWWKGNWCNTSYFFYFTLNDFLYCK